MCVCHSLSNSHRTPFLFAFSVFNHFDVHHQTWGLNINAFMSNLGPHSCFKVYSEGIKQIENIFTRVTSLLLLKPSQRS